MRGRDAFDRMRFLRARPAPLPLILALLVLGGCAAGKVPAAPQEVGTRLSGEWSGEFISRDGNNQLNNRYPVRLFLRAANGRIDGEGDTPNVAYDPTPRVWGSYANVQVVIQTSSAYRYDLAMERDDRGQYYLTGAVSGPKRGRVQLWKM